MPSAGSPWKISNVSSILFPTDFSGHAEHAFAYALSFAKHLGAKLHIYHAITTPLRHHKFELEAERRPGFSLEDEVDTRLMELVSRAEAAGVDAERHWRHGVAEDEALKLIKRLDIGLVIMGTHGRDKPDLTVVGSKYLKTMRISTVPVMAVKDPEHEFVEAQGGEILIKRILCPCDLTSFSHYAVPVAAELCRHFGAELVLAHVAHTYEEYAALKGLGGKLEERVDTQEVLDPLVHDYKDFAWRILVVKGDPVAELTKMAKAEDIDLIVMATHGRQPIVRCIVGSVMERLIIDTPCPLLTVRPELMAAE